ncbi:MAG: TIR domain-containing protein [Oscillospiraceae bacterium]|nr:TIR domain-containing protein [Oscillospiraceae bacterium]
MLYIIYGLTTVVTKTTLIYFQGRGIRVIDKLTWLGPNPRVQASNPIARLATEEEVRACDYIYENHGRLVGFHSEALNSAVYGRDDALLTFSSQDLSFLRELKTAYGDHVAIIYAFIEDRALEALTNALPFPGAQKLERLAMGRTIKERFLAERELFDEVVLFTGEGTHFDLEHLQAQYAFIINKYNEREKELVPLPYRGTDPYIFVSYARKDKDTILPLLRFLNQNGCRVWYDDGIAGGDNWKTTLASRIEHCTQFLLFSSQAATESVWTRREISRALKFPSIRRIVTVRLDDARFDDGIEWPLEDYQQLSIHRQNFQQVLLDAIVPEVIERIGK